MCSTRSRWTPQFRSASRLRRRIHGSDHDHDPALFMTRVKLWLGRDCGRAQGEYRKTSARAGPTPSRPQPCAPCPPAAERPASRPSPPTTPPADGTPSPCNSRSSRRPAARREPRSAGCPHPPPSPPADARRCTPAAASRASPSRNTSGLSPRDSIATSRDSVGCDASTRPAASGVVPARPLAASRNAGSSRNIVASAWSRRH